MKKMKVKTPKCKKKKCFPSLMVHRRKFISMNHTHLLGDKGKKKGK